MCLIFVTQMSEENFSLTDFVCQMTEMKSTVHPKEILLFKNGLQLFNHIYITIHEWIIREGDNFVVWWSRSFVDVLQKVAGFHFFHDGVVNISLANSHTFPTTMLLQFKQTHSLFAEQRSRRPTERVSGKFIDVRKFQKCSYEARNRCHTIHSDRLFAEFTGFCSRPKQSSVFVSISSM